MWKKITFFINTQLVFYFNGVNFRNYIVKEYIGQSQVMKNLRISDSLRISVLASQILATSEFCNDCGCHNS